MKRMPPEGKAMKPGNKTHSNTTRLLYIRKINCLKGLTRSTERWRLWSRDPKNCGSECARKPTVGSKARKGEERVVDGCVKELLTWQRSPGVDASGCMCQGLIVCDLAIGLRRAHNLLKHYLAMP